MFFGVAHRLNAARLMRAGDPDWCLSLAGSDANPAGTAMNGSNKKYMKTIA